MKLNKLTQMCECQEQKNTCSSKFVDLKMSAGLTSISAKTINEHEIYCLADKTCLNENLLCNGFNDCSDGMDEFECEKRITYYLKSFHDERCIPKMKVCDGQNDCGDWNDEKDCLGAYCDDGTCLSQEKLCDDVYHCLDFSDERSCKHSMIFR
ncbi:hypothetical protein RF11_13617 [Thelohanellus kitauei]|uniref:Uncharacterized protein n=1 Tax=Thelohanellus kitauei TaxID=669202 RepID=A0A0C2JB21_THEKT|nr:hypothetical protein RF11_13617 [Thelohanellus kitauei]